MSRESLEGEAFERRPSTSPTPHHRASLSFFVALRDFMDGASGAEHLDDRVSRGYLGHLCLFVGSGKRRNATSIEVFRIFPACLDSTAFVVQNAVAPRGRTSCASAGGLWTPAKDCGGRWRSRLGRGGKNSFWERFFVQKTVFKELGF